MNSGKKKNSKRHSKWLSKGGNKKFSSVLLISVKKYAKSSV